MSGNKLTSRQCNESLCLGALLAVSLAVAVAVSNILPYYRADEYADWAMQLVRTGHIYDDFLPIGYPALLALGFKVLHSETGFTAVNILLSLVMLASAWFYLRLTGLSVKLTLLAVSLLSVYPDFSLSYNKTQDTNITAIALFAFMSFIIFLSRDKDRVGLSDLLVGLSLAFAGLIRPNMLVLVPVSWFFIYRSRLRFRLRRAVLQSLIAGLVYCAITVLVHGSMFFPRNGAYNLYSGYNPYTIEHLWNEEDSIYAALPAQHIPFTNNRDPSLDPIYRASAIAFIRHHPGTALHLDLLKFTTMMLPDFHVHPANTPAGGMKILTALAIPLWLIFAISGAPPRQYDPRLLVSSVLVAIILPFCLIISTQRFRIPLDFICWTDLGAIVLLRITSPVLPKTKESSAVAYTVHNPDHCPPIDS